MLRALDLRTGSAVWAYDVSQDGPQKSFHGRMLVGGSLLFVGTDIPSGHIYAFDRRSGAVRWRRFAGLGVCGDIVGAAGLIYALTKEDTLLCIEARSGAVRWSFHPDGETGKQNDGSPLLSGRRIFFHDSGARLYCFDAPTGRPVWERALPADATTSPCVQFGGLYIGSADGTLRRINAATGMIEAELSLGSRPHGAVIPAREGLLVLTGHRGVGEALLFIELDLGSVRWRAPGPGDSGWTTYRPALLNGSVVVGDASGIVRALRCADGFTEWTLEVDGTVKTVSHAGGVLFVGTFEGALSAFALEEHGRGR